MNSNSIIISKLMVFMINTILFRKAIGGFGKLCIGPIIFSSNRSYGRERNTIWSVIWPAA